MRRPPTNSGRSLAEALISDEKGAIVCMTDTITTADLADLLGMSTRNVRHLDKRGILVRAGRGIALAESVRRYCTHLRDLATGRGGEVAITSATAERARLAKAQAEHIEMKYARARLAGRGRCGETCALPLDSTNVW
jgi:hypothetical protein